MVDYLRPSFLYPAALAYQLANGIIHRFNHGLLTMYPASDGADIVAEIIDLGLSRGLDNEPRGNGMMEVGGCVILLSSTFFTFRFRAKLKYLTYEYLTLPCFAG